MEVIMSRSTGCSLRIRVAWMLVLAIAGFGSVSRAETWVPSARSPYGTAYSYDADSLKREGSSVTAWIRGVYATGGFEKARSRYNCGRRAVTTLSSATYRADGSLENNFTWTDRQQTELPVLKGTYAEKILLAVCSRK